MREKRSRRLWIWGLFVVLTSYQSVIFAAPAGGNEPFLKYRLKEVWRGYLPLFTARCGITALQIRLLPYGTVVLSHNDTIPLTTASVTKLFTSSAALHYLGANYRFFTDIRGIMPHKGILSSSLLLYSYGNPFWTYEDMKTCLSQMVDRYGIKTLEGRIFVNMSSFSPGVEHLCIDNRCSMPYNPVISPLSLNFNTLKVTALPGKIGGPAKIVLDPPSDFLTVQNRVLTTGSSKNVGLYAGFKEDGKVLVVKGRVSARLKRGLSVEVNIEAPSTFIERAVLKELGGLGVKTLGKKIPAGDLVLIRCYGPTLADAIKEMNTESNNFVAEIVERLLGLRTYGPPGTRLKGLRAIEEYLYGIGVPRGDLHLTSGSGLSRDNRATVRAFEILLTTMYFDRNSRIFFNSLAKNGDDGTLKRYWKGDDFVVAAKTGTLRGVVGLSGYVLWDRQNDPFVITVLCNDCSETWKVKRLIESFVRDVVQVFRENLKTSHSHRAIRPMIGGNTRLERNRIPTT